VSTTSPVKGRLTEGIEDGLSVLESLGIGAWAAGSASRMPALGDAVPNFVDAVSIFSHDDRDGRRHAAELQRRLNVRRLNASVLLLSQQPRVA
jgi:hypothetical protein